MSIIGFYAACDKAQLATLVGKHSSSPVPAGAGGHDRALFAAVPKGGESAPTFYTAALSSSVTLADAAPPADDTLDALDARVVGLRAAPLVYLQGIPIEPQGGPLWEKAHAAATNAALAQLTSERACFAIAEARHIGVVGLDDGPGRVAPLASGPCSALIAVGGGGEEGGGDEEEEAEEEEEEEVKGGKKGREGRQEGRR